MDRPSPELVNCPHCGAKNPAIDEACAECGKALTVAIGPRPKVRRIPLWAVMIVIAVVAVCLAPVRVAPGISVVLAVFLLPACVRTIAVIEGRKADGRPMLARETMDVIINSCLITVALVFASSAAFVVTCFPVGLATVDRLGGSGLVVACLAGSVPAIAVLYFLGRRIWPRKD
jgi:hypothetical protein